MPGLFHDTDRNELISRINRLNPDSPALWGKMNVTQMLAHCQAPVLVSFGELKLKRGLIGFLFGKMAKKKMMAPGNFPKSLPTVPEFMVHGDRMFEKEKQQLLQLIQRFAAGPSVLTDRPYPFFGKMMTEEWDLLQWKHLDHHLRQFGV